MTATKKKVLVTGASGMLGAAVVDELLKNNFEVFGISRTANSKLSLENQFLGDLASDLFISSFADKISPEIIIHTAAFVNLNFCEENKVDAFNLHVKATGSLAAIFPNATFIYISTDSVFDGETGNYREADNARPLNYYALSKYLGEEEVLEKSNFGIVLRVNIYGGKEIAGSSLAEWALKELRARKIISGFNDVFFNPLYICQLAKVILDFISFNNRRLGTFHVGCNEFVSKYTFLLMLADAFNLDRSLINESKMRDLESKIKRPFNTTLNTSKFEMISGKTISLEAGMLDFCNNQYKTV